MCTMIDYGKLHGVCFSDEHFIYIYVLHVLIDSVHTSGRVKHLFQCKSKYAIFLLD